MDKPDFHFPEKTNPDALDPESTAPAWPPKANPDRPLKKRRRKNRLLKLEAVARRLNASLAFCYQLIAEDRLRHVRLGKGQGCLRVPESALRKFINARMRGGEKE